MILATLDTEIKAAEEKLGLASGEAWSSEAFFDAATDLAFQSRPSTCVPPILQFDDEPGSGSERQFWIKMQEVGAGVLRRWIHPQVGLDNLCPTTGGRDSRRVDFVICPPWSEPVVWEIHGEFDPRDKAKSDYLRRSFRVFDEIAGSTSPEEVDQTIKALEPRGVSDAALPWKILDAAWISSQVDLALHFSLCERLWSAESPCLCIHCPHWAEPVVQEAVRCFVEMATAVQSAWELSDQSQLVVESMTVAVNDVTQSDAEIEINPTGPTYLEPNRKSNTPLIVVRRACFPFDLKAGSAGGYGSHSWASRPSRRPDEGDLLPILTRVFGFNHFNPGQYEGVCRALGGVGSLLLLPTAGGKSIVFQLAGLFLPGVTIVVEPWRALIEDQARNLENHGINRFWAIHRDRRIEGQQPDPLVVYLAPERFYVESFQPEMGNLLEQYGLNLLVIDEAHAVSEAGHSFRPSYLGLRARVATICKRNGRPEPTLVALTATAADVVIRDVCGILAITAEPVTLRENLQGDAFVRRNIEDQVVRFPASQRDEGMKQALQQVLNNPRCSRKGIIFCASKGRWTDKGSPAWFGVRGTWSNVMDILKVDESQVCWYAGGDSMSPLEREDSTSRFLNDHARVMVATNAFGTGIDIKGVNWTCHLGLPSGVEALYQEMGRAGRDGSPAFASVLVDDDAPEIFEAIADASQSEDFIQRLRTRMSAVDRSAKGSACRQLSLLVGERASAENLNPLGEDIGFISAYPGWQLEWEVVDRHVLTAIARTKPGLTAQIEFLGHADSFVWKSVIRMQQLGVIRSDYQRTFHMNGPNHFEVVCCDPEEVARPDHLVGKVKTVVGRLRGTTRAEHIASELFASMREESNPFRRILAATRVLIRAVYDTVRDCRVSSLSELCRYLSLETQSKRHNFIEDYFRKDPFYLKLRELSECEPTIEVWRKAFVLASSEPYWRLGTFQRLLAALPGSALPHFLLTLGGFQGTSNFESNVSLRGWLTQETVPRVTKAWAVRKCCQEMPDEARRSFMDAVERILEGTSDLKQDDVFMCLASGLRTSDGSTRLAARVVATLVDIESEHLNEH